MAKQVLIYKITNPKKRVYIGQTVDFKTRLSKYRNLHCKCQPKLYNSFLKYGFKSHLIEIIYTADFANGNNAERYYQDLYSSIELGLNCRKTISSDRSGEMSLETKKLISKAKKGKTASDETKQKMRESSKKRNYKHSDEVRKLISDAKKYISDDTRQKLREGRSKIVLDTQTGIYYNSALEASVLFNIKRTTMQARLSGQNINNTSLIYV